MAMNQISPPDVDFLSNLPSELIIDILSRLHVRTIINCKCICKSWLDLIETREFAKLHHSKSVPVSVVCEREGQSQSYEIYEVEDGLHDYEFNYNRVAKLNLPFNGCIRGSVDGLLFLCDLDMKPHSLYVCNPFTRDYIVFQCGQELVYSHSQVFAYGFGVSELKAQHKVVRIFHDRVRVAKPECQVYTIETGKWRRIAPDSPFDYISTANRGLFLEGNLHWLVYDLNHCMRISYFDLETELFSSFTSPPRERRETYYLALIVLRGRLCLCTNSIHYNDLVIWSMTEYGDEKSWTKIVSEKDKTMEVCNIFKQPDDDSRNYNAILHTPSFLSLTSFGFQNVISF